MSTTHMNRCTDWERSLRQSLCCVFVLHTSDMWRFTICFAQEHFFPSVHLRLSELFHCCWPTYNIAMSALRISLPMDPPDRRLPGNIATETLLPSLPSLPPQLCRPGSVALASLGLMIGGRDWANIWLIVHCRLCIQFSSSTTLALLLQQNLCWTAGLENCTVSRLLHYLFSERLTHILFIHESR